MGPLVLKDLALAALFVFANIVIATPLIKLFARTLSLKQAFAVSTGSFGLPASALAIYFLVKSFLSLPSEIDGLVTLVAMVLAGTICTQLARRQGVRKVGWLGVGARTALTLIIVSWLLFAINLGTHVLG